MCGIFPRSGLDAAECCAGARHTSSACAASAGGAPKQGLGRIQPATTGADVDGPTSGRKLVEAKSSMRSLSALPTERLGQSHLTGEEIPATPAVVLAPITDPQSILLGVPGCTSQEVHLVAGVGVGILPGKVQSPAQNVRAHVLIDEQVQHLQSRCTAQDAFSRSGLRGHARVKQLQAKLEPARNLPLLNSSAVQADLEGIMRPVLARQVDGMVLAVGIERLLQEPSEHWYLSVDMALHLSMGQAVSDAQAELASSARRGHSSQQQRL
mmetsp:Transcript_103654/g.323073  ORF Transcript_103654/g.323073 Transcript_103654/m.323073 type:complete len:268 (+) Transcript_103654:78-881(+)